MEKGAWDGKACGAMAFALNFLWLLSLFQSLPRICFGDKESDKTKINENNSYKITAYPKPHTLVREDTNQGAVKTRTRAQ
jgi:hypothetical protein